MKSAPRPRFKSSRLFSSNIRIIPLGLLLLAAVIAVQVTGYYNMADLSTTHAKNRALKSSEYIRTAIYKLVELSERGGAAIDGYLEALNLKNYLHVRIVHSASIDSQYGVEADESAANEMERLSLIDGKERGWETDDFFIFIQPLNAIKKCQSCHQMAENKSEPVPIGYTLGLIEARIPKAELKEEQSNHLANMLQELGVTLLLFLFFGSGIIRAEKALKDSRKWLSKAQEMAHLGSWDKYVDTGKITWSDETYRILGLPPQESRITPKKFMEMVHPDDRQQLKESATLTLASDEHQHNIEYRIIRPDGTERRVHEQAEVQRNADGMAIKMTGIVQDITERRKVEEALKESEMKFRFMAQTANDAVIVGDSEGNIISWNPAAVSIFGYTEAEALGKPITILIPERLRQAHTNGLERYKSTGKAKLIGRRVEVTGLRKHGEEFPLEISISSWKTEANIYFSAIIHDITGRKKTEESLRKLKNSIEYVADVITITDTHGVIEYVNPAVQIVTGYTPEELIGKKTSIFQSGVHDHKFYESMWKTIKSGNVWKGEIVNRKKTGEHNDEEMTIAPVLDENGEITNFVAIKRDISKEKMLDKQLIQSEKLSSIGTLSAGVAHEILNPLNIINMIVQVLQMKDFPEDAKNKFNEIATQVKRATKITNNLRMFARPKKAEITTVDMQKLFDQTASLLEHDLKLDNIEIKRNYGDIPTIQTDEDQMAQVFLNLLTNAKDALKDRKDGLITVATKRLGGNIEIRVSDNGIGIPDNVLGKIFDPFFSTKSPGEGTGLGLSIMHSIIEKHQGTVNVDTKEGVGTTFVISLPIEPKQG